MLGLKLWVPITFLIIVILISLWDNYDRIKCVFVEKTFRDVTRLVKGLLEDIIIFGVLAGMIFLLVAGANFGFNMSKNKEYYTKFEVAESALLMPIPEHSDKYVLYDEDKFEYTYYTFNTLTRKVEPNIISCHDILVFPVLEQESTVPPQYVVQINKNEFIINKTTPISKEDSFKISEHATKARLLFIPINSILVVK